MSHKIFISYKRDDKDLVFPIVEDIIENTGYDCWIDINGIESGDQFQNVIIDAIEKSKVVIFMLSQQFIQPYRDEKTGKIDLSKQTFTEKEVMYALRHNKRVVPLSIDGTTIYECKWLEFNCSGLDYINWNDSNQKYKLFRDIKKWISDEKTDKIKEEGEAFIKETTNQTGTCLIESFPEYACLHIHCEKACKIYRFGQKIGEINENQWGELYLRAGKHELHFISENQGEEIRVIDVPTVNYTDFIHVEFGTHEDIKGSNNRKKIFCKKLSAFLKSIYVNGRKEEDI